MSETTNESAKDMTPEQIEAQRVILDAFYTKQIPRLKKQLEYEKLQTQIEKERFERFKMQFQMASAMAPAPGEGNGDEGEGKTPPLPPDAEEGKGPRKLKRDPAEKGGGE